MLLQSLSLLSQYILLHLILYHDVQGALLPLDDPGSSKKVAKKCGGTLTTANGIISSPKYPTFYPDDVSCDWIIQLKTGFGIRIELLDLDIEDDPKCSFDHLDLLFKYKTKYKRFSRLCGQKLPKSIKVPNNRIKVSFSSDDSTNGKGFKLKWESYKIKKECGGSFNSSAGSIVSPNSPGYYPFNADCEWTITVPITSSLSLNLNFLDIESSANCQFDYLQIFDGLSTKARSLGKYCGQKLPSSNIKPSTNKVLLKFVSDSSQSARGFNISWTSKKIKTLDGGPRRCGTTKYSTRIVGGIYAKRGGFPWQAALFWRVGISKGQQFCGASLITDQWVVTAAHCFVNGKNPKYFKIILGDHNLKAKEGSEQEFNVTQIIIHDGYNPNNDDNDIALMKLSRKVTFSDHVNTICLPSPSDSISLGTRCRITGWGATGEHNGSSSILMEAEVPIISRSTCSHDKVYGSRITNNMMCAGYQRGGIDTCQGDSGGPLQCKNKKNLSQWVLHGITSWGKGCGRQLRYGVYAIVRNYLLWIRVFTRPPPTKRPTLATSGPVKPPVPPMPPIPPLPPIPGKHSNVPKPPLVPPIPPKPPMPPIPFDSNYGRSKRLSLKLSIRSKRRSFINLFESATKNRKISPNL